MVGSGFSRQEQGGQTTYWPEQKAEPKSSGSTPFPVANGISDPTAERGNGEPYDEQHKDLPLVIYAERGLPSRSLGRG